MQHGVPMKGETMIQVSERTRPLAAAMDDEDELIVHAKERDHQAFATLMKRYDRRIYRLAIHITRNEEDAKDVLQESFLKAYTHLDRFENRSRFYTWLVRITVNEALMKLRKSRQREEVSLDEGPLADDGEFLPRRIAGWEKNPEQRYLGSELQEILKKAIDELKLPYRIVFQLRDIDQLSIEETAQALQLSHATVKTRLLRARLQLRELLTPYFRKRPSTHSTQIPKRATLVCAR
jgi:RNA polymerase sigma-70 factor, ECF subfamily